MAGLRRALNRARRERTANAGVPMVGRVRAAILDHQLDVARRSAIDAAPDSVELARIGHAWARIHDELTRIVWNA